MRRVVRIKFEDSDDKGEIVLRIESKGHAWQSEFKKVVDKLTDNLAEMLLGVYNFKDIKLKK